MTKDFSRTDRVADAVHRISARLIRQEIRDPRIGMVTVSSVEVSPDLKHAKVYVTVLEEAKALETLKVLNNAAGFFRSRIADELPLRTIPKPRFIFDHSTEIGARIESLLESCVAKS